MSIFKTSGVILASSSVLRRVERVTLAALPNFMEDFLNACLIHPFNLDLTGKCSLMMCNCGHIKRYLLVLQAVEKECFFFKHK